jgi:hypothetical protein
VKGYSYKKNGKEVTVKSHCRRSPSKIHHHKKRSHRRTLQSPVWGEVDNYVKQHYGTSGSKKRREYKGKGKFLVPDLHKYPYTDKNGKLNCAMLRSAKIDASRVEGNRIAGNLVNELHYNPEEVKAKAEKMLKKCKSSTV